MQLLATPEERDLRETARSFLTDVCPPERLASLPDGPEPVDGERELWATLAELGWLGLAIPEHLGGAGMGLRQEIILFEEAGAALLPAPLFSTLGLAVPALQVVGHEEALAATASGEWRAALAWAEAAGPRALSDAAKSQTHVATTATGSTLAGTKRWVIDGQGADRLLVVARSDDGPVVVAVEADDAAVTSLDAIDVTRPFAEVVFAETPAQLLATGDETAAVLETVWLHALTLAAAEAVGIIGRMLKDSAAYASSRHQFGRPIGTYQAVSHKVSDLYIALELSRALVADAADAVDHEATNARVAVATAAAKALPSAVAACETAIQIHGGIGMTWESPLHRYYKRALGLVALDGPPARHRAVVAEGLADESRGA